MYRNRWVKWLLVVVVGAAMTACGGDGGTSIIVRASSLSFVLDINHSSVGGNWRTLTGARDADGDTLSVSIVHQGDYGTLTLTGDSLVYLKTVETNTTDTAGVLRIADEYSSIDIPVNVATLYWKQLASKTHFTIGLKSDGTVWGWGSNMYGQLGDGTTIDRDHPVQESTHATNWISVAAGYDHSLAVTSNGTLYAWGKIPMVNWATIPQQTHRHRWLSLRMFPVMSKRSQEIVFLWHSLLQEHCMLGGAMLMASWASEQQEAHTMCRKQLGVPAIG